MPPRLHSHLDDWDELASIGPWYVPVYFQTLFRLGTFRVRSTVVTNKYGGTAGIRVLYFYSITGFPDQCGYRAEIIDKTTIQIVWNFCCVYTVKSFAYIPFHDITCSIFSNI